MLHCVEDNEARVIGTVCGYLTYSHDVHGERFYRFMLKSDRLSENADLICVTVSEKMLTEVGINEGRRLEIAGQFRSYNNYSGEGNRLILTLFAKEITVVEDDTEATNEIYLNGYICKPVVYRVTPFGREIADILLAVNRAYNKSDYLPCIAWGRNARFARHLAVGQNIKIWGRMQSRNYQKKISDSEIVTKTAYEISVNRLEAGELFSPKKEEPTFTHEENQYII
ncbi:MAG: single-stranded DNA-binding protein [Ruminococcaceae bacterium]|nr:single-stranded DNA-binding protein [Oscillospiraceae bacterium]